MKAGNVRTLETGVEHPKGYLFLFLHTSLTPPPLSLLLFPLTSLLNTEPTAHLKEEPRAALLLPGSCALLEGGLLLSRWPGT